MKRIKEIKIDKLFGRDNLVIPLFTHVSSCNYSVTLISGDNGSGKTTILEAINKMLHPDAYRLSVKRFDNIHLVFEDDTQIDMTTSKKEIKELGISPASCSYKCGLQSPSTIEKHCNEDKIKFLLYTINEYLKNKKMLDIHHHFSDGLKYNDLSDGEKQMIGLFETAAVTDKEGILLLDNPEMNLHIDWQERLISDLLSINPSMQLVIVTHAPSIIIRGWQDCIINIEDCKIQKETK